MDTTMTCVDIRPFTHHDYAAITRLHNLNYPDFLKQPHEFRFRDEHFPQHCHWARWVAVAQGQIVGFGGYHQTQWAYHPRKFSLWFAVGFFLPIVGAVAAALSRDERRELRRRCPGCGKVVKLSDAVCTRCGTDLEWPDVAIAPLTAPPPR